MENTRLSGANANYIATNLLNDMKLNYSSNNPIQQQPPTPQKNNGSAFRTFLLALAVGGTLFIQGANYSKKPQTIKIDGSEIDKINKNIQDIITSINDITKKISGLEKTKTTEKATIEGIKELTKRIDENKTSEYSLNQIQNAINELKKAIIKQSEEVKKINSNKNTATENKVVIESLKKLQESLSLLITKTQEATLEEIKNSQSITQKTIVDSNKNLKEVVAASQKATVETLSSFEPTKTTLEEKTLIDELLEMQDSIENMIEQSKKQIINSLDNSTKNINESLAIQEENLIETLSGETNKINKSIVSIEEKIEKETQEAKNEITKEIIETRTLVNEQALLDSQRHIQEAKNTEEIKNLIEKQTTENAKNFAKLTDEIEASNNEAHSTFIERKTEKIKPIEIRSLKDVKFSFGYARDPKTNLLYTGIVEHKYSDGKKVLLEYKNGSLINSQKFNKKGEEIFKKEYEYTYSKEALNIYKQNKYVRKYINGENVRSYCDTRKFYTNDNKGEMRAFGIFEKDNINKTKTQVVQYKPQKDGFILSTDLDPNNRKIVTKTGDVIEIKKLDKPFSKRDMGVSEDGYRTFIINHTGVAKNHT